MLTVVLLQTVYFNLDITFKNCLMLVNKENSY